jgi:membrane protease YdiL (CAAX protease family)
VVDHDVRPLARGGVRAAVAAAGLTVVWGAAFATEVLPFFPTIVAGGILTGLAGVWVRRGTRGWHSGEAQRRDFPPLALSAAHARLAVVVAVAHFAIGHGLFAVGELLLPALTETASAVYTRAGGIPVWAAVVLGAVITAPLEEIFWRGGVQPLVTSMSRDRWPRMTALPGATIVITTIVYAAFHLATAQIALVAAALLGGLVWGWLMERTRSLGATMLAHGLWTGLMLLFPPV